MIRLAPEDDTISDFTSQISDKLGSPIATGSFGVVYRCTIESSLQDPVEVAVKVFKVDTGKDMDKNQKRIRRELNVWLRLKRPTIVPLLGIAYIDSPFPALVSKWISSGTLYAYLEQQATITTSARVGLGKGIADGLHYLHSENVIHGDLHPANVLIDGLGNPCLADFGLATVVGDPELQLSTITLGLNFDCRWRAPEVLGIENGRQRPTFMSDIYSFGSVVFFIVSGNVPWKEKQSYQISIELSKRATPARSHHIPDNHWDLIRKCWSWDPRNRPGAWEVLDKISGCDISMTGLAPEDDTISDFTSQISGKLRSPIATGSFGVVYRCTIESSLQGPLEVAVKVFKIDTEKDMDKNQKGIHRELNVWLRLKRPTIVPLLGIAYIDPPFPALVSQWMSSGTLYTYLKQQATITISARVGLGKGVADGLHYLHSKGVIHGDLHPENVLIDGLGNPCLTDFGLATVVEDPELRWSTITLGLDFDCRWRAPEVLGIENDRQRPTFMSDIYSFGSVVFFIVSGNVPWKEKNQCQICIELLKRATPARPHHIFDDHWDLIQKCWSRDPRNRPGAWEVLNKISGGSRPRNVVVCGEVGAGKSSLINLIMGSNVAITAAGTAGCTSRYTPYDVMIGEQCFKLWDTAGLYEGSEGVVPAATARKNLTAFLRGLDQAEGVHLLIYCVRGARARAVGALLTNYKIFPSVISDGKVPIVIVVTCLEDVRPQMEDWWNRNKNELAQLGIQFSGHACVTTLKDDPMESPDILERRAQSYQEVCQLILNNCSQTPHKRLGANIKNQRSFLETLNKKLSRIVRVS